MKSIKLLMAALFVSAAFAACTKEEAPAPQTNEVIGAELVGTNISVDFIRNTDTKLTDNGWENTDELGLAWAVNGTAGSDQTNDDGSYKEIGKTGVAANHLFAIEDGSDVFTTKGNVYKGWHFGYYPFRYMEKPNQNLDFEINPDMKAKWNEDYYTSAFYLSAREFLTKEKHLENNKLTNVTYQMERAVNTIGVRVTPSTEFAAPALSGLNITKLTISAGSGNNVFTTGKAVVIPKTLAKMQYDVEGEYDADATREAFFTSLPAALAGPENTLATTYSASTTIAKEAGLDLSGAQLLRLHTLPAATPTEIKTSSVKFTIAVNGGTFSIGYKKNAEEGSPEAFNNKAIEDFVAAYAEGGSMTSYFTMNDGEVVYNRLALDLKLTPAYFTPNYKSISNIEEWNDAVAVADALGKEEVPHFVVDGAINITADDVPAFPKKGLTVETKAGKGSIVVKSDYVMPEELVNALDADDVVVVNAGATLTIEEDMAVSAAIDNNGTIKIGVAEVNTINNKNRVEVVYGSKVTFNSVGTIVYNVLEGDTAYKINQMVANVQVNTLVISEDITFDLSMKDANVVITDPYYTSETPGQKLLNMNEMNFELNNGTLKADANSGAIVNNIEVLSGENNAIWNVNVEKNLKVSAGKVAIDAEKVGNYKESLKVKELIKVVGGELNANVEMFTKTVNYSNAAAVVKVNTGNTIWYTEDEISGGTKVGKVEKFDIATMPGIFTTVEAAVEIPTLTTNPAALEDYINKSPSFKEGSTIILPADAEINLKANAEYNASFTLVGNGNTTLKISNKGLKVNGVKAGKEIQVNLKNLTIDAGDSYGLYVRGKVVANLENVTILSESPNYAVLIDNASDQINGVKSTLNATNVTIKNSVGNKKPIAFFTLFNGYNSKNWQSYVYVNYNGGNIDNSMIIPDPAGAKSTGNNVIVNGVALPASK